MLPVNYFRWEPLWLHIAKMFDMDVAYPVPAPLQVWPPADRLKTRVSWPFGDLILNSGFDNISSTG